MLISIFYLVAITVTITVTISRHYGPQIFSQYQAYSVVSIFRNIVK